MDLQFLDPSLSLGAPDTNAASISTEVDLATANIPIAVVGRIMKQALPEDARISLQAKECMQDCVGEFISFITSEGQRQIPRDPLRANKTVCEAREG